MGDFRSGSLTAVCGGCEKAAAVTGSRRRTVGLKGLMAAVVSLFSSACRIPFLRKVGTAGECGEEGKERMAMMTKSMLGCSLMGVLVLVGVAQAQQASTFPKSMLIQSTPEGKTVKTRGMLQVDQDGVRFEANDDDMLYEADYPSITKLI